MENKVEKVLFSEEEIDREVRAMGKKLTEVYEGKDLLVVSLLRGSFIFAADLVRAMDMPLEIDFLTTSSYGHREYSEGIVDILQDVRSDVKGRDVLIVDDIVDSGHTLEKVYRHIDSMEPKSLKTCVLLDKPDRRENDFDADYVIFTIPDVFIVGYGLNYGNHCRNIPYIYTYVDPDKQ